MIDKHGEEIKAGDRVMMDGALLGTIYGVDETIGSYSIDVDGEEDTVGRRWRKARPTGWQATDLESLGDGINQAMRAAKGQPS